MEFRYFEAAYEEIDPRSLAQIIKLVESGGQVDPQLVAKGLKWSRTIAGLAIDGDVVACCCLKTPRDSYLEKMFRDSRSDVRVELFAYELGYIATSQQHEGKGYCKKMLENFMESFSDEHVFSTTRKPAMVQILEKFGFKKSGNMYGNALELMVFVPEPVAES